mgnify:CR=1 FL=1
MGQWYVRGIGGPTLHVRGIAAPPQRMQLICLICVIVQFSDVMQDDPAQDDQAELRKT